MKRLLILLSLLALLSIVSIKPAVRYADTSSAATVYAPAKESKEEKEVKEYKEYSEIQKITKNFPDTHHFLKKIIEKKRIPAVLLPTIMSFCKSNYFKYHQTLDFSRINSTKLMKLDDTHLVSGYREGIIKVWEFIPATASIPMQCRCIQTLNHRNNDGHTDGVKTLAKLDDTHFASGSLDSTIKIWQLIPATISTPIQCRCIQTLDQNNDVNSMVTALIKLDDAHFVSGSFDGTIKIWESIPEATPLQYRCIQTLEQNNGGHIAWIYSLARLDDKHFVSSSYDKKIKIWELIPATARIPLQCKCIQTLDHRNEGHIQSVYSLARLDDKHFVSSSYDKKIKIWEFIPETASMPVQCRCIQTLNHTNGGHTDRVTSLTKLDETHFASGSTDRKIKIWEFIPATASTPLQCRCIQTLIIDNAAPVSLTRMSEELIVGRTDGTIQTFKPVLDISAKKSINLSNTTQKAIFSAYLFIKNNRNKIFMLMAALYFIKNRKQIINYLPHLLKYLNH